MARSQLVDQNGSSAQTHLIRRLIALAGPLFTNPSASATNSQAAAALRLLASEVSRMSKDPILSETCREAILEGAEGPNGADSVLKTFNLQILLSHPSLTELSALERLVFTTPFLILLFPGTPSTPKTSGLKRQLGLDAAKTVKENLSAAVEQLNAPASKPSDLGELSPLSISKLFAILLSDFSLTESEAESNLIAPEQELKNLILAVTRNRLGPEVTSQALTHAFSAMVLSNSPSPSAVSILSRLCATPALCSPELIRVVFTKFAPDLTEAKEGAAESRVAGIVSELIELANQKAESGTGINLTNLLKLIHELQPNLRWAEITRSFDSANKSLPDSYGLSIFAQMLANSPAPQSDNAAPASLVSAPGGSSAVSALWSNWANPAIQISLIERLLFLPPELFSFGSLASVHKIVSMENVPTASPTVKNLAQSAQNSPWNCAELISTLIRLSETQPAGTESLHRVHELIDRGCKTSPELILIGLLQMEKPWNSLQTELLARLLKTFLSGHPAHQLVFARIYQTDQGFLLAALRDFYAESEINVTRILDIALELKIQHVVLELRPFSLSLDLAALAGRREFLNLDKWLTNSIQQHGTNFVRATLEFVGHKVKHDLARQELDPAPEPTTLSLSAQTVATFMRALRIHHELFTGNDVELFKEVRTQCLQLYPRLMNFSPANSESEPGMAVVSFSPEIEAECDALYKRMYDQQISVENVVSALQRAKESSNEKNHQFLACFLHGLFDEHRFFNTYPPNELSLTAALFGDLIQHQLINFIPLGIAVRYVLDALRNPPESNWFRFGIQALTRFQSRLSEWPQLANSILQINHVVQLHPEIAATARKALQQRETNSTENGNPAMEMVESGYGGELDHHQEEVVRPAFTAISVARAQQAEPEEPDEETSDKILFIVNNLAPNNFEDKVSEMTRRILPSHFAWFAHYLVAQRVSIEPNNHSLYQKFLDALEMPQLVKKVLYETFIKLSTLLNSDKTVQSSTERTLLKNLGSWLGGLTLAKNKPIKHENIAFKELLIQGYDSGRLIVAIPFVCKVLEQSSHSKVFKPPNPWLMAIVKLLIELYQFADLKLNLKFEIEVLCKSLNIDLKEVEPSDLLRNRSKEESNLLANVSAAFAQPNSQANETDENALNRGFSGQLAQTNSNDPSKLQTGNPLAMGGNQPGYSLSLQGE